MLKKIHNYRKHTRAGYYKSIEVITICHFFLKFRQLTARASPMQSEYPKYLIRTDKIKPFLAIPKIDSHTLLLNQKHPKKIAF